MQPQRFSLWKNCFLSDLLEPMSCPFSARPRVAHQTSPYQTPIDKRRIKTIFNPFQGHASALQKHTEPKSICEKKLFSTQRPLVLGQIF
jgi:hypothetical protein